MTREDRRPPEAQRCEAVGAGVDEPKVIAKAEIAGLAQLWSTEGLAHPTTPGQCLETHRAPGWTSTQEAKAWRPGLPMDIGLRTCLGVVFSPWQWILERNTRGVL